jgi:hypothetical protein
MKYLKFKLKKYKLSQLRRDKEIKYLKFKWKYLKFKLRKKNKLFIERKK